MVKQFYFKQINLAWVICLLPVWMSNSSIWPYEVLLLQTRLDLGVMAMKEYSAFSKAPALLELHHQIV